jgi:hypothetical protein
MWWSMAGAFHGVVKKDGVETVVDWKTGTRPPRAWHRAESREVSVGKAA